jgi:hypothetical protein
MLASAIGAAAARGREEGGARVHWGEQGRGGSSRSCGSRGTWPLPTRSTRRTSSSSTPSPGQARTAKALGRPAPLATGAFRIEGPIYGLIAQGDMVARWEIFRGTHVGDFMGLPGDTRCRSSTSTRGSRTPCSPSSGRCPPSTRSSACGCSGHIGLRARSVHAPRTCRARSRGRATAKTDQPVIGGVPRVAHLLTGAGLR